MKKFLVVIPAFQSLSYIQNTLDSIGIAACKAKNCKIHVHVQDAGSDQTSLFSRKYLVEKFNFHLISQQYLKSAGRNLKHTVSGINLPDSGMYDGLMKAFLTFRLRDFDWITWIGSDDTLSESSFERIKQICEFYPEIRLLLSSTGVKDEVGEVIATGVRPCSRETIKSGLHNLHQLPPIQQEGSFIKTDLFMTIIRESPFTGFSVAGDWNLWRLASKYEIPVTVKGEPLGYFHKRANQLSSNTNLYTSEIFQTQNERYLQAVWGANRISKDKCQVVVFENSGPNLVEWSMREYLQEKYQKKYNRSTSFSSKTWKKLQAWPETIKSNIVTVTDSIIVFDKYWQEPAKTEKHAKDLFWGLNLKQKSTIFIAFPWATLIDKLNHASPDQEDETLSILLDALSYIKKLVHDRFADRQIISVCQHIHFKRFIHFFEELKINHIFWTHKVINEDQVRGIHIHAFPLYPVNIASSEDVDLGMLNSKKYLFSFIGARANKWYLTDTRNIIFNYHEGRSDVLVTSRDKWHFQADVYDQQVLKNEFGAKASQTQNILNKETKQFLQALRQSVFSLCPSGSGPNSIRLWESLESNIVPVVLADTYDPPGLYSLWKQSSLFIEESEESIRHIDTLLKDVDEIRYQSFTNGMKQIVYDYGKEHFITDILRLIINIELGGLQCLDPSCDKRPNIKFNELRTTAVESSFIARSASYVSNRGCELFSPLSELNSIKNNPQLELGISLANIFSWQLPRKLNFSIDKELKIIKYFLAGNHSHRTPLSYCNFQNSLLKNGIQRTLNVDEADFLVTGFSADIPDLMKHRKYRDKPILIVSEEPLWDITWSKTVDLSQVAQEGTFNNTSFNYFHLNHFNSDIFNFNRIPYFLLTDSKYISRYILAFQKILKLSKNQILNHWNSLPRNIAFVQEKRLDPSHEYVFDERNPVKLSKFRTELAMNIEMENILIEGKGWPSQSPYANPAMRQEIPDWHLDKLTKLNKSFRFVSAIENVHFKTYITEKIFDAYASFSIPIYYADSDHFIHGLVPGESFVNLYGHTVESAVELIQSFEPSLEFAENYLSDIAKIQHYLCDFNNLYMDAQLNSSSIGSCLRNIHFD